MLGVFAGIVATLAAVGFTEEQMGQFGMLVVAGGGLGLAIGRRVSPMQLPQTVAALHSVVGLAAVMTSAGSVLGSEPEHLTTLHLTTAYFGVLIGGVTFTGKLTRSSLTDYRIDSSVPQTWRSDVVETSHSSRSTLDQLVVTGRQYDIDGGFLDDGPYRSADRSWMSGCQCSFVLCKGMDDIGCDRRCRYAGSRDRLERLFWFRARRRRFHAGQYALDQCWKSNRC